MPPSSRLSRNRGSAGEISSPRPIALPSSARINAGSRAFPRPAAPSPTVSRRRFIGLLGSSAFGVAGATLLQACSSDDPTIATITDPGEIHGQITTVDGEPTQEGRIFLMRGNGLQTGRYADPDSDGRFRFAKVAPGEYQLRFHAPRVALVPAHLDNPVRLTVPANGVAETTFLIELGYPDRNMVEIYMGDDFFQHQPYGEVNARTTVSLGTLVCWYHVGQNPHNVVGGPWEASPDMMRGASFVWIAGEEGVFPYLCTFHSETMRSELEVVS